MCDISAHHPHAVGMYFFFENVRALDLDVWHIFPTCRRNTKFALKKKETKQTNTNILVITGHVLDVIVAIFIMSFGK